MLFTYHAETLRDIDYNLQVVRDCCEILNEMDNFQVVATYANADFGGDLINGFLEELATNSDSNIRVFPSLGNRRYLSFLRQVRFVMGNSSSGIIEAPFLGVPVINIGNRQSGRHLCGNVLQCDADKDSIRRLVSIACNGEIDNSDSFYWGDGHTSERIIDVLRKEL